MTYHTVGENMTEKGFAMGSIRRVAKQIVDLGDKKRKEVLMTFDSDMRCRIIEEMVNKEKNKCRSKNKEPHKCENDKEYRIQALLFHPDRNKGCPDEAKKKFNKLNKLCKGGDDDDGDVLELEDDDEDVEDTEDDEVQDGDLGTDCDKKYGL